MTSKKTLRIASRRPYAAENSDNIFSNLTTLINWDMKLTIAGYYPIPGEIDDLPFLTYCHEQGFTCGLPYIIHSNAPLTFKTWRPCDILRKGMYDIPAPSIEAENVVPDIILAPLIAFDKECYRLGKGGGFYDRTLTKLRKDHAILAIGLAYDQQEIEHVIREAHDEKLDYIVTPTRVLKSD